jgi:hypothetical protein
LTWVDTGAVVRGIGGAAIDVVSAWKEGSTWYMLYRSDEWGGDEAIGLATYLMA